MADEIVFFGAMDRQKKQENGKITSAYPAWYFDVHLDDMKESIERKKRDLVRGVIPPSEIEYAKEELRKEQERYNNIVNSKPKLTGKQKDELASLYKSLEQELIDSMPTYTEMMKGHADPHEEVKKMTNPIISVGKHGKIFESLNIPMNGNRVTRNGAARAFKIIGKVLGERSNIESIRRDRAYGRYKPDVPLDDLQ